MIGEVSICRTPERIVTMRLYHDWVYFRKVNKLKTLVHFSEVSPRYACIFTGRYNGRVAVL